MFKCINVTHSTICPLCTVCWCQKLNLRLLLKVALATQLPGCSAFCCVAAGFEVNLSVDAVAACWVLQLLTWRGPGWQVHRVGCNLLCPQHSMQYSCIRAPVLCLYKKRKSSPCSDGEAGQTHHIHTSETHAKEWLGLIIDSFLKYHLLKNILCIRFHLLYTTFIFNLDVKSLYKCGHGLLSPPRPVWKSLYWLCYPICEGSIFILEDYPLQRPGKLKVNAIWGCWLFCIQMKLQTLYVSSTASKAPFYILTDLQHCVLCWCHRQASAFQKSKKSFTAFF